MDEELQPELETNTDVQIATETSEEVKKETSLDSVLRLEDLMKSEKEIKVKTQLEGVTKVEPNVKTEDRVFAKKADEKKVYVKRRLKTITGVYATVITLLLAFVGVNIATLAILNKDIKSSTNTIQKETVRVEKLESLDPSVSSGEFQISLNEPRDYSEDKKELTWLDKVTILFRNIFG